MKPPHPGPFAISGAVLALIGALVRVNNAFRYPTNWGFDARFNWIYIERLMSSWSLPAPGESWATSHPPLFYYLGAALGRALGRPGVDSTVHGIRLLSAAAGLATVALVVLLVRRSDPGNHRRALLAAGLLLFLPAHIYMSAMLNEEILASAFTSLAVAGAALALLQTLPPRRALGRAAGIGAAAGLAWLTKLSGLLAVLAAAAAYLLSGARERTWRTAIRQAAAVLVVAASIGGWYYALNRIRYGYFYPQDLPTHRIMFSMPPGERGPGDYLRVPLATWTDPQLLSPGLLHSVWGSTYATVWFDGHRMFLPRSGSAVRAAGTLILLLALLPTAAFLRGLGSGLQRLLRHPGGPDGPLSILVLLTIAGYVLFTWRNPWFASVKGSYLLGLSVPFAYYASEALARWTGGPGKVPCLVWTSLALLVLAVFLTFSYGPVFAKWGEIPGLEWRVPGS